jgi:hypothetical protein
MHRGEIAAIARATGLSRPTIYRILGEDCNASSGFSDGGPHGTVVCGTRQPLTEPRPLMSVASAGMSRVLAGAPYS